MATKTTKYNKDGSYTKTTEYSNGATESTRYEPGGFVWSSDKIVSHTTTGPKR
jgi:hypothetical protein